jgi:hypothetical protein
MERTIPLARMHEPGLHRMMATAAVVQGPYEITWQWSRAMHDRRSRVAHGYWARHGDDDRSIALLELAAGEVTVQNRNLLLDPSQAGAGMAGPVRHRLGTMRWHAIASGSCR